MVKYNSKTLGGKNIMTNNILNVLVYASALETKSENFEEKLRRDLPWLIMPNAILHKGVSLKESHSKMSLDQKKITTIVFPENLEKEPVEKVSINMRAKSVDSKEKKETPMTEIFCEINLNEFDKYNWSHPMYCTIRSHLVQDALLQNVIRYKVLNSDENKTEKINRFKAVVLKKAYQKYRKQRNDEPISADNLQESFSKVYGQELGRTILSDLLTEMDNVKSMSVMGQGSEEQEAEFLLNRMFEGTLRCI